LRFSLPASEDILAHLSALLRGVREWRLVSSSFGEESPALSASEHTRWSRQHNHAHPYREILIPLAGESRFGFRGRTFACRPGTIFLCGAGEPHDLNYPPLPTPLLHLWLTVSPGDCLGSVMAYADARLTPLWRVHVSPSTDRVVPCVDRVWNRALEKRGQPGARERLVSALYLLLTEIADRAESPERAAADAREECVRIARRMLDEAHGCGLDLAALARATGYSKYHFHRLFHAQTSKTVHQYADERRRTRADELIAANLPRKEIAFELGFSSPSAFSRWLHQAKRVGATK